MNTQEHDILFELLDEALEDAWTVCGIDNIEQFATEESLNDIINKIQEKFTLTLK